jgi:hypothetical protein
MQNSDDQKPPFQAHCLPSPSFSPLNSLLRASTTFKRFGSPSDTTSPSMPQRTTPLNPPGLPLPQLGAQPVGPARQASFYPANSDHWSGWPYGNIQPPLSVPNAIIIPSTAYRDTQVATTSLPGYNLATRRELAETPLQEKSMYALRSMEHISWKAGKT